MLSKNDLRIVPYEPGLLVIINASSLANLHQFVEDWLKIPELRRPGSKIENYKHLDKAGFIFQMTKIDWPNGLTLYQVCQMKMSTLISRRRKCWNVFRLTGKVNRGLDMVDIKRGMEKHLDLFFQSYAYGAREASSGVFKFTLAIADKRKKDPVYPDYRFGCMIYYMESNVLVSAEYILTKPNDVQFREAVLNTFSASGMHIEPIQDILVNTLGHFAQNETSEAVFAGFSKNGLDANPLDIRQKRHLAFEESRLTSEEKKRIVPMDLDKLEQRFDSMGGDFSWKSLTGHRRIHVDLDLPFNNNGDTDPLTGFEDSDIKISMAMFGGNIGEGVKELIQQGKIKENPPIWLKGLSVSNAKRLVVNSDGVSKEVKEAVKHKFV